jgi:hypothetical protein
MKPNLQRCIINVLFSSQRAFLDLLHGHFTPSSSHPENA